MEATRENVGGQRVHGISLEDNRTRIAKFAEYTDNWNGYGAKLFDPVFLNQVLNGIISDLKPQPEIYPLPDGGLQLEWEKSNGEYLELEIHQGDTEHRFFHMPASASGDGSYCVKPYGSIHINETVRGFYAREIGLITKMWSIMPKDDFRAVTEFLLRADPEATCWPYEYVADTMKAATGRTVASESTARPSDD